MAAADDPSAGRGGAGSWARSRHDHPPSSPSKVSGRAFSKDTEVATMWVGVLVPGTWYMVSAEITTRTQKRPHDLYMYSTTLNRFACRAGPVKRTKYIKKKTRGRPPTGTKTLTYVRTNPPTHPPTPSTTHATIGTLTVYCSTYIDMHSSIYVCTAVDVHPVRTQQQHWSREVETIWSNNRISLVAWRLQPPYFSRTKS